jgi:diacylglycerol kinase (ATP)
MPLPIVVIANPKAGAGRARSRAHELSRALTREGLPHTLQFTAAPGHASVLARAAVHDGVRAIVAVGGDGTLSEVAQAYVSAGDAGNGGVAEGPPLGYLSAGTGADFARTFADRHGVDALVQSLSRDDAQPFDLGLIELSSPDGKRTRRAFVNMVSVGLSARINRRVTGMKSWLGGSLAFLGATVFEAASFEEPVLEILLDGRPWHHGPTLIAALANGQFFGGGMRIAPQARVNDAELDVVCFGGAGFAALLGLLPSVHRGKHVEDERIRVQRARTISVVAPRSTEPIWVDVDGECPGCLPLRAWLAPSAMRLAGCG